MILAIYIVVILECDYVFKERDQPVETFSSKSFLWRTLLTMEVRETKQKRVFCKIARVSPKNSGKNSIYCAHMAFRYLSSHITWTESSEQCLGLWAFLGFLALRFGLSQYHCQKQGPLDSMGGGFLPPQRQSRHSAKHLDPERILWKETWRA